MKDPNDVRGLKAVRNLLGKRGIDFSRADVRVVKGRVDIRGMLSVVKGFDVQDLEAEVMEVAKMIRRKAEIKEVSIEVIYR